MSFKKFNFKIWKTWLVLLAVVIVVVGIWQEEIAEFNFTFKSNHFGIHVDESLLAWWDLISSGIVVVLLLVISWLWAVATHRARTAVLANQFLSISQQRLQYALEGSNLALWDFNIANSEIYFSERMAEILGKQTASFLMSSKEYHALVHPEDIESVRGTIKAVLDGEASSYRATYRVRAEDGSWKWISSYGKAVDKDADNKVLRMTGTISDITELRQAQETLRLQARAMEESIDGILIADATSPDMPIVYCNSAFERMTGYNSEEVLGRNCRFLQLQDREQLSLTEIRSAQQLGKATTTLLRNYRKDGTLFWNELSISPVHDENGSLTHFIGIANDVTARILAEEALRHENEFSTAAINALPGTFFVLDRYGKVVRLNENVMRIAGYTHAELVKKEVQDLFIEEDKALIREKIAECYQNGQVQCEARIVTKSGQQLPYYFQGQIKVLDGQECLIGTGTDISNLKQMQQALIHSQSLLNTIVEHIPAMVFLKRASDLSYVLLNKVGEEILEYGREAVLDKTDLELFTPAQAQAMMAVDREVLATKHARILPETVFQSRSGWTRHLYTVKTALCDEWGQPTHLLGIAIDISDQKRAERKLRNSEERLREAQEIAHLGHWSLDLINDKLHWSDEVFRIFGQTQESYRPNYENFIAAVHPEDLELVKQSEQKAMAEGTPHSLDHRIIRPDGEVRWIHEEARVITDPTGKPTRLAGTVQDITARKLSEQAVHISETRLRDILDNAVDAIITIDSSGIIESVNTATEKLFGYGSSELVGQNVSILMPAPYRSAHDGYLQRYMTTGAAHIIGIGREVQGQRKDGSVFPMDLAVSETWFEQRRKFTGFIRDISERKQVEVQLLLAKDQAEEASRAKSEFLANMSHELRTPMNAILGFAQLLEADKSNLTGAQNQDVKEILSAGRHLLELINELLDLARIEAGRMDISIEAVAVRDLMSECVQMIEPLLLKHEVSFKPLDEKNTQIIVLADRIRLRQVLLNLLSNAVKYNQRRGEVRVSCSQQQSGRVRIEVMDTGIGIAPERYSELFDPFSRLGAEETATEGTGIGLAITRRLVELMNGEVGYTNREGGGSIFWLELPASDEHDGKQGTTAEVLPSKPQSEVQANFTVLYIEDNPANLRFMSNLLARRANLRLMTAIEPEDGIAQAMIHLPDLILLDIHLPGMDGFEVFKRLQTHAATRDIPVIAVSANAMPGDIKRAMAAGFRDYCTKPIDISKFMQTIDTILKPETARSKESANNYLH